MGLQSQVEIQCLQVVSGDLRLNRRLPATTRVFSVIVSNESHGRIVVNRRVYKAGLLNVLDAFAAGGCVRRFVRCQREDQGEEAGEEAEEEGRGKQVSGGCQKQAARDPRGAESGE